MKDNMLEVGDRIACYAGSNKFSRLFTVERVTKTMAVVKVSTGVDIKFKKAVSGSGPYLVSPVGNANVWSTTYYTVVTPEFEETVKEDIERQRTNTKVSKWLENHASVSLFTDEEKRLLIKTFNL